MNSPLPSRLLRSADQARVPAALAGVLGLALLVQLVLPVSTPLPSVMLPPLRAGTGGNAALPEATMVPARPDILANPIFAPRGAKGHATGSSADGFTLLGTAVSRGEAVAIVRTAEGTRVLRPGEAIAGYRLGQVDRGGAVFAAQDGRHALKVGGAIAGGAELKQPASAGSEDQ